MQTLITGGAGFIGSHLAASLAERGHRVRVIDNLSSGRRERLDRLGNAIELIIGDIRDGQLLQTACAGAEVVFHLAAQVSVAQSVEQPLEAQSINATGTLRVLEAARQAGARRVVQASSCAVYGNNERMPIDEEARPDPLSPYAATKLAAEQLGQLYTSLYDLDVVALRFFNVYGPGQDPRSPYAAVVPRFFERLAAGAPVTIFGDGFQSRDFVYVGDIVGALWAAATAPGIGGQVFNVGSGVATSVVDLADAIATALGVTPTISFAPGRPGEVRHSRANPNRLAAWAGYRASTDLPRGLTFTASTFALQAHALGGVAAGREHS